MEREVWHLSVIIYMKMMVTMKKNTALRKTIHNETMLSTSEPNNGRKKSFIFPIKTILHVIIGLLNVTTHP